MLPRGQANTSLEPEAAKMMARRQTLRSAAHALEQRLNADTRDHVGAELLCSCGGSAPYSVRHALPYCVAPQLKPWPLAAAPETSTMLAPPSTMRTAPVINDESSLARNTQTPVISSGSANRCRGKLAEDLCYAIVIGIERLRQRTSRVDKHFGPGAARTNYVAADLLGAVIQRGLLGQHVQRRF